MPPRRTFGATWWGRAWLDALEGRAVHDANRLPRGRTYARQQRTTELRIGPGGVSAQVQGSRPDPYDVILQIRVFRDDEWECVLDAITARAAHAAALLDGELDPGVLADAEEVEVDLLPRSGELRTACSCPDWAEPCKHAAAVCYLVADALDADPFDLLLLRGRTRAEVLDGIRQRRAGAAGPSEVELPDGGGVVARDAWARTPGPVPPVPTVGDTPGRPAPWPSDPPGTAPFHTPGLTALAADAAARAWGMLALGESSALDLAEPTDLARRAASADDLARRRLAERASTTDATLAARAEGWSLAGAAGVAAVDEDAWPAPVAEMAVGREALVVAGVDPGDIAVRASRMTVAGSTQYRLGLDRRWWRFEKRSGRWHLAAPPADDLDELVTY